MVEKRWNIHEVEPEPLARLSSAVSCSQLLAGLLHRRGIIDPDAAARFLHPKLTHLHPPSELPDMDLAVGRIERAVRTREPIAVFGDYDVDGITSTCLLVEFFNLVGVSVRYRLPNRLLDGYGIRSEAVRELAAEGVKLIITVDNGTSAFEEVALARALGVDVVVTDHHEPPERLPPAVAVVNPWRADSRYPFKDLAGVGVAFKLVWALAERLSREKKLSEELRNFLLDSLALVALGTISDVVPLLGENRILAKYGLVALERTRRPGLRCLVDSILRDRSPARLCASDVAFRIGPRLNAAGRLGEADAAIRLLSTRDPAEGSAIAESLERENRRRQKIEGEILQGAVALIERDVDLDRDRAIVLAAEGWHAGVIGIVAARVVERYFRPTLLIAIDGERARGSARSIRGVHITEALARTSEHLLGFGGHEMAAGVEVRPDRIDDLRRALNDAIAVPPAEMVPEIEADGCVRLREIGPRTLEELQLLAPHGVGNPEPLLSTRDLEVVGVPRIVGSDGRHLSFTVRENGAVFRAIAFGKAEFYPRISRQGARVSLLVEPQLRSWQGRSDIELCVRDLRVS
jgi:single-stranded-DNA-specific exonuclease